MVWRACKIRSHLENTLMNYNQAGYSIDIWVRGDWDIYLRSQKSYDEMSIDFRRILGRIAVIVSTSGALASFTEGHRIFLIGVCCGTEKRKLIVKNMKATNFSKTLRSRTILKLKTLGAKSYNFELRQFESSKHWLKSRLFESCWLSSINSC